MVKREDKPQPHREQTANGNGSGGTAVQTRITPPTRADVAKLARVSGATVSYVLNDVQGARISEATRKRVLAAAAKLGYVPDELASSLRSGRSDLVLLPFFDWPYNPNSILFLQNLARNLDKLGYSVMLRFFGQHSKHQIARRIASFHPAGVIVMSEELSPADTDLLTRNGVKAVLTYGGTADSGTAIPVDFTPSGELVARYLLDKGYRHLAVVVPRDPRIVNIGLQRFEGFQKVAHGAGLDVERLDMDYSTQEAAALAAEWKEGSRPNAVFAYNDEYAFMLLSALQDVGLRVPEDVAIVGHDNLSICELTRPRLTSVESGSPRATKAIADYFDALMQDRTPEERPDLSLHFRMLARESA